MSIRTKLLAATLGLNGLILILALWLFIQSQQDGELPFTARAELTRIAADVPQAGDEGAKRSQVQSILLRHTQNGYWQHIYIIRVEPPPSDEPGKLDTLAVWDAATFYTGNRPAEDQQVTGAAREAVLRDRTKLMFRRYVHADDRTGLLAIEPPYSLDNRGRTYQILAYPVPASSAARILYVFMIFGVIVLTAVLFWLVSVLVVHPLRDLASAAERIAVGDYAVKLAPRGTGDELDQTVSAFNRMADEIAEYQGQLEDRVLSALTRIKKAEQHLVIAQRLTATGKLAAGLAHEINNPLGGMKNAIRSLTRGDLSPEKTAQYLALMTDGLARVEQTVKQFLTFTPRAVEPRRADLVAVVQKALALATHRISKRRIEVQTTFPEGGAAAVYGDAHELQQVILNLLLNAADATPDDGHGRIDLSVTSEPEEVVLTVTDTGAGMSPEDQDRCFDMFFTTKEVGEGTGLGLAVVHNIVTNHGGRIEVQSEAGEGTTFRIHLPLDMNPAEEALTQG